MSWKAYPFLNPSPVDLETAARFTSHENNLSTFLRDLDGKEALELTRSLEQWDIIVPDLQRTAHLAKPWPLKILVLGGIFEPHHNELCFFNCFERLRGKGYITWRTALYEYCTAGDLRQYDLVIFSRPRDPNCRVLMDACASGIPSIVMIDDNWMALGADNERYRPLFGPGQPQMETFLDCVRRADVTLVYNSVLAEDIAPFARRVVKLSPHVDSRFYEQEASGEKVPNGRMLAGFSGSERPETGAFRGLARFANNHSDVDVLFMGAQLPPELKSVDQTRLHWKPYQMNYPDYTRSITRLRPDILLAPLDDCRASASKAPNKFLEISVLGAAGIYSRVRPYTEYVKDEQTGLLVGSDEQSWADALERLYHDVRLRKSIASAAHQQVLEEYSVERVIPQLLSLFETAVS
jgi:glycosyltransferase involved in cell wall biosynthesis